MEHTEESHTHDNYYDDYNESVDSAPYYSENSAIPYEDIPLVGKFEPLQSLEAEYAFNANRLAQVNDLKTQYSAIRRVKKDGSCFYRAFVFGLFEHLVENKRKLPGLIQLMSECLVKVLDTGYPHSSIEEFYDDFISCLKKTAEPEANLSSVEEMLADQGSSNSILCYTRILAATHMKLNPDMFEPFIAGYANITDFCRREVEPMWVEAEQPQIIALSTILKVQIAIVCIDSSGGRPILQHFPDPENKVPIMYLLFEPGHYNLIYLKS